jgi:hypothetical protein
MSDAEFDFESESETLLAVIDTLSEKPKAMGPKYRHKKCWEVNCVRESKGGLLGLCSTIVLLLLSFDMHVSSCFY